MRKLNITRKKSFVASLGTMKIYIEDPAGERDICGYTCKKLGEIKNGETQSFDITENASRVFVIADNTSKNYCCDMQNIPEGNEDITLSGENKLNLLNGNAFRFDGETNEEIEAVRKKVQKRGWGSFSAVR